MLQCVVFCVLLFCKLSAQQGYEIPQPTIQILHPKGFTVSIPDYEGIELFGFRGTIVDSYGQEQDYSGEVTEPYNGVWTFANRNQRFNIGDEINYSIYVDYFDGQNRMRSTRDNQKFVVRNLAKNNGQGNKNNPGRGNQGNKGNKWNQGNQGNKWNQGNPGNQGNKWGNQGNQGNHGNPHYTSAPEPLPTVPTVAPTRPSPTPTQPPVCNYSPTKLNGKDTCSGQLIFSEDFDGLNSNRWQTEVKFANDPDYEFVIYGYGDGHLYTENGKLHIKPTLAEEQYGQGFVTLQNGLDLGFNCTGVAESTDCMQAPAGYFILPPILSGRINSKISFSFLYGRIDVKAKLPKGDWIYPELFLTPKKFEYGATEYASGEIRIAFLPGNSNFNKELVGGIVLATTDAGREYGLRKLKSEVAWNEDFHIFSTVWKPDGITLLVDGKIYGNISPPPGGFANVLSKYNPEAAEKWKTGDTLAPLDKEMFITVGVGVGGFSFPDTLPGKPYINTDGKAQIKFYKAKGQWLTSWSAESELIVDYIKVYAL